MTSGGLARGGEAGRTVPQTTNTVLMIRPAHFFSNPQTQATNSFQAPAARVPQHELLSRAQAEFDALASTLRAHGVQVVVEQDSPQPVTPDALFPNNWVSFHAGGTVVLYPMLAANRRAEVRPDLIQTLGFKVPFVPHRIVDLRQGEKNGAILEGTGSVVLDRPGRTAYACLSPRTTEAGLAAFCQELGYAAHAFRAVDDQGAPIYHTNVLLCIGDTFAVAGLESVPDPQEREQLAQALQSRGRELIAISREQLSNFAGNCLGLRSKAGEPLIVLSARALGALNPDQRAKLARHGEIVSVDLHTIETYGGGSARCMLAEVFLAEP